MDEMRFVPSSGVSLGVELELQLVRPHDLDLSRDAAALIARLEERKITGAVKPEITESMIELNSSVHPHHDALRAELEGMREAGGEEAVYLVHAMTRYVPHFIALSAASPYYQGEDTAFQSSRLTAVNAFPLAGHMPFVKDWAEFLEYFDKMRGFGVVESMKDFYWDIRPKPEFGTIEIRVCDTPLTVERAAQLAAYAQALARWLLDGAPRPAKRAVYLV